MSTRLFRILAALCGIFGVIMLIISFVINPGPQAHPTVAQLIAFRDQYRNAILIGAWLQAVSPPFIVLFAFAIVHLAGATTRLMGWMTLFGGTILVVVSLIEVTFYLSAVNGNPATTGMLSLDLRDAAQHLYSLLAAPLLFFPLAAVILASRVLPHIFGYIAFVLGAIFVILGIVVLFFPLQYLVDDLSIIQGFWWLIAAIILLVRTGTSSNATYMQKQEHVNT